MTEPHVAIEPSILYLGTPVVLISTLNEDGTANVAPMSSAWWLGWRAMLGLQTASQTPQNMMRTGECVLNLATVEQVDAVNKQAAEVAGYARFNPDSCLMNRYEPGSRLSLHQDRNEHDFDAPIVSVSLGLPATFLWGGATRSEKPMRVRLFHGDVVVWGGPARLTFHGVDTLHGSGSPAGEFRYNLTFRAAR